MEVHKKHHKQQENMYTQMKHLTLKIKMLMMDRSLET